MKPIGFWLNRTDRAITTYFDARLLEFGLDRLAWQVLNVVRTDAEVPDTTVHSELIDNAGTESRLAAIELVLTDGWAYRPAPDRLALTDLGRDRHTLVAKAVDGFRETSQQGITLDEYRTAVSVLERMTRNLDPAPE